MTRVGATWLAVAVATLAATLIIFDQPGFIGATMNADMLMPASFGWDVGARAGAWHSYHLPRVPSLIPDLAVTTPLMILTGSARWTALLYGALQLSAFVAVAGWLAARLARRAWVEGCAVVAALLAMLLGIALGGGGAAGMILSSVLPVIHFGPLVLALLAAGLAAESVVWATVLVSALVYVSDKLLVVEFVAPLLVACAASGIGGWLAPSRLPRVVTALLGGLLAGSIVFGKLKHFGLQVDYASRPTWTMIGLSLHTFWSEVPPLLAGLPVVIGLLLASTVAFLWFGWSLRRAARRLPADTGPTAPGLFLWWFAAAAMAAIVVFAAAFYADDGSLRYLPALWAWLLIGSAAALLRLAWVGRAAAPIAGLAALAMLGMFIGVDHGRVALLRWDQDVASCLRRLHGLHAGLADYWTARPAEIALDWRMQIDQVTETGRARIWENDPGWYRHSLADPAVPPEYDFLVMRALNPDGIAERYGPPDRVAPCGDTAIWVYRDRAALTAGLLATLPR